jgi:hypothetical protein
VNLTTRRSIFAGAVGILAAPLVTRAARPTAQHARIRAAVADLESARATFRRADAALDAAIETDAPRTDAEDAQDEAEKSVAAARDRLMAAMDAVGLRSGAVIVGGLVYVGDGVEWLDGTLPQVVFPAAAILNLDATKGGAL